MPLINNIDFEEVKSALQEQTFIVWGDITKNFFVAQEESEKDNAHVHMLVSGNDLNALMLTFVSGGIKRHPSADRYEGDPQEDKSWKFEFNGTEFNGDQIQTALKGFGAKEADAKSVQETFSAVAACLKTE